MIFEFWMSQAEERVGLWGCSPNMVFHRNKIDLVILFYHQLGVGHAYVAHYIAS